MSSALMKLPATCITITTCLGSMRVRAPEFAPVDVPITSLCPKVQLPRLLRRLSNASQTQRSDADLYPWQAEGHADRRRLPADRASRRPGGGSPDGESRRGPGLRPSPRL